MDLFGEFDQAQAFGLEGDLGAPGGVNLAGMPNAKPRGGKDPLEEQRRRDLVTQNARNRQRAMMARTGDPGSMIPGFGPAQQYAQSQNMANNTMQAIADENDSRVSQMREMRRMEHEQQMERMRQDALLQRLQMESLQQDKDRELQMKTLAAQGVLKKVLRNDGRGGGFYTTYE